jgi:hypothetical protein
MVPMVGRFWGTSWRPREHFVEIPQKSSPTYEVCIELSGFQGEEPTSDDSPKYANGTIDFHNDLCLDFEGRVQLPVGENYKVEEVVFEGIKVGDVEYESTQEELEEDLSSWTEGSTVEMEGNEDLN